MTALDEMTAAQLVAAAIAPAESELREGARRRIVSATSLRIARVIIGPLRADQITLIRDLARDKEHLSGALPFLLAALGKPFGDEASRALDAIRRHSAADLEPSALAAVSDFVRVAAPEAPVRDIVGMLDWASGDALDDGDHVRPFVTAAATALERITATELAELQFAGGMTQLFALGTVDAAPILDRWLATKATASVAMRRLFDAHEQLQRRGADRRIVDWLGTLWASTPERDVLAEALAHATGQRSSLPGREWLVDWAWSRFMSHPAERAQMYRAFLPWRDDLIARRNALPRNQRPGGASAVEHLRVWWPLDLPRQGEVIEEAVRLAALDEWPALVDAVFAIASEAPPGDDHIWGLVGICRIGQLLTNLVRGDDPPALDTAVDRFTAAGYAVVDRLRADGREIEQNIANRIEDIETSIRLCAEARQRRIDTARRAAEQAEAEQRRATERAEAEAKARRLQEEAARRQQELAAAIAARPAPVAPNRDALPNLELAPIDRERFFSGALPTLVDYARVLIQIRSGGDAMAVMTAHGIDLMAFSTIAQAWTQLISARPELAARFGALMIATWT